MNHNTKHPSVTASPLAKHQRLQDARGTSIDCDYNKRHRARTKATIAARSKHLAPKREEIWESGSICRD